MKYLGTIDGKKLYAEWNESQNQLLFILDGKRIALYDMKVMNVMEAPIVFRDNTIANELSAEAKDEIQRLARSIDVQEIKAAEDRDWNSEREQIARVLDVEEESIKSEYFLLVSSNKMGVIDKQGNRQI